MVVQASSSSILGSAGGFFTKPRNDVSKHSISFVSLEGSTMTNKNDPQSIYTHIIISDTFRLFRTWRQRGC